MQLVFILLLSSTASLALALTENLEIPPKMEYVYTCKGKSATFPWRLNEAQTKLTDDIRWFHQLGSGSEKMVAIHTHDVFMPTHGRMSLLADNRLKLRDTMVSDSGVYEVQATLGRLSNDSNVTRVNFTFYLQVSDGPVVQEEKLEARQAPAALWNYTAKQWSIKLLCGTFSFKGEAPIKVEWILPNGETRDSDGYENGQFYLVLPTPVRADKSYTCRIPQRFYPDLCVDDKNTKKLARSQLTEASFFLDEVKTRLAVYQAEQERLDKVVTNISSILQGFRSRKNKLQEMEKSVTDQIRTIWSAKELCQGKVSYKAINDNGMRLVNQSHGTLCDKDIFRARWYRWFVNGQDATIPTSCTPASKCGTNGTLWIDLQGKPLPPKGEVVEGRTCASLSGNCCRGPALNVTMMNCGQYFIYYMVPPSTCNLAYCLQMKN